MDAAAADRGISLVAKEHGRALFFARRAEHNNDHTRLGKTIWPTTGYLYSYVDKIGV